MIQLNTPFFSLLQVSIISSDKLSGPSMVIFKRWLNPFQATGGHFDPEKFKKLYVDRASKIIPQIMLMVRLISQF